MYFVSSLTLGFILLFRATFAQSAPAPYVYPDEDEDEEALIDRLASLAAAVGPESLSRQMFSSYDLPQLGRYIGETNEDILTKETLAKLPRQFAYRPDDVRFYMPAEQFPNYFREEKADIYPKVTNDNIKYNTQEHYEQRQPALEKTSSRVSQPEGQFMKKNQIREQETAHHATNILAEPSNIQSSGHSVENPLHNLYPIENDQSFSYSDMYYIGLVAGCSAAAVVGIVAAGICWIHQRVKAAAEVDYPAYGVTGPSKDVSPSGGDRKLAQSAQMYHYQHQKQQMAALQKGALQGQQGSAGSDVESEDDNEDDNDYTVYECPGLAPAGEMEVKNPLFDDEPTPATPNQIKPEEEEK